LRSGRDGYSKASASRATLVFSSDGGNTDEALALYNFIRSLARPITIHAAGHVGSAAIPVFDPGTADPTAG
jgi:ATP-dependent protease ClpP protease subunit